MKKTPPIETFVLVTFYVPADGGTQFVVSGKPDYDGRALAARHIGCRPNELGAVTKYVSETYLKKLPEYEG